MQKVYALWKVYPFAGPSHILELFKYKKTAIATAKALLDKELPEYKPEYDDYGLVQGIDYKVEEMPVNEEEI